MNPLHRGRAIVARSRRPLAWGTLVALWILQAAGALPIDAPSAPDGATTPSSQVVRADAFDDFLESLFGDPDDPPPPPEPRARAGSARERGGLVIMAPSSRSSTYADEIADRMRDVCAGLSFTEVARRTETNRETARRYLAHGRPSAEFMARLCESFGISGTWILTGRGPRFDPSHQSGTLRPHERTRTPSNARSSRAGRAVSAP